MLLKESMIFLREQKCNFLKTKLLKLVLIYLIIFLKKISGASPTMAPSMTKWMGW